MLSEIPDFHYYRNDLYSKEKGQYAKHLPISTQAEFIARESDGIMTRTVEQKRGGYKFEDPWYEVNESEWNQMATDYDEFIKKRDAIEDH